MESGPGMALRTRFRRVVQLAPYETCEAEVAIEQSFAGEATPEDINAHVASMFTYVKAAVYDQLGLGYQLDDETGVIMEAFPGSQVVKAPAAPAGAVSRAAAAQQRSRALMRPEYEEDAPPAAPTAAPLRPQPSPRPAARPAAGGRPGARTAAPARAATNQDDLWGDLMDHPDQWQDCRPDKASGKLKTTHPDYKALHINQAGTNYKVGLWLDNAPDWFQDPWG